MPYIPRILRLSLLNVELKIEWIEYNIVWKRHDASKTAAASGRCIKTSAHIYSRYKNIYVFYPLYRPIERKKNWMYASNPSPPAYW